MHQKYSKYIDQLKTAYPQILDSVLDKITPQLVSPFVFPLRKTLLEQAQKIVVDLNLLCQSESYKNNIKKKFPYPGFQLTPSVLCSLDTHVDENGNLKIIEINTNASSFLINAENDLLQKQPQFPHAKSALLESFRATFATSLQKDSLVLIVDEKPSEQNMYPEFLMFKELIKKEFSVDCQIADPSELMTTPAGQLQWQGQNIAAIYNRFCDFYFATNTPLALAYQNNLTSISPNPWGYATMADKNRLVEWNDTFFSDLMAKDNLSLPYLQKALIKTHRFSDFKDAEELWAQRGKYFFKPPNAYGGKSVYKGKSISRVVFQRIYADDYLAQEIIPAPEVQMQYENTPHTFKYDLRFYFFKDQIHLAVARLYQGQLTNMQTLYGGLTAVEIV